MKSGFFVESVFFARSEEDSYFSFDCGKVQSRNFVCPHFFGRFRNLGKNCRKPAKLSKKCV